MRRLETWILRMRADITTIASLAAELQIGAACVRAIGRDGHDRQRVLSTWQGEAVTERPVRAKIDFAVANGHQRVWLRGPVNNQFRVDVEPDASFLLPHAVRA